MRKIGILRCQKLETICPMADCLYSYFHKTDAFANHAQTAGEDLQLVGVATCGGCAGNKEAEKAVTIIDHMVQHGIQTLFLSSCLIRHEFFPPGLENKPLPEVEGAVRCFFSESNPQADAQAHDVACALCAGTLEGACPNQLASKIVAKYKGKLEIVTGTHYEHFQEQDARKEATGK
ncbi:CGGC domain-containing protein [Paradesulfitobacterium ferrireducens]|uniref:CGGC domain-containing protein n=1 Tax=Paradesulfitobacterium ferrireducens TaxID=2816476 RepID=UPI001A8C2636|nr:CGGC domain-containing protein [Paradesulfitobacterium ferrireducens]